MTLHNEWKKVEEEKDEDLSALLDMPVIEKLASKDPVEKIRRGILINAGWGMLIAGIYIYVLLRFPIWQVAVCFGFIILIILWTVARTLLLYRKLHKPIGANTLLQQMEQHYYNIRKWMNLQKWVGLIASPVSVAGGILLAAHLAGKSIDTVMHRKGMLLFLLIVELVLVLVCYWLAKWMIKKAFGQYAGQLKANIDSLKNEK